MIDIICKYFFWFILYSFGGWLMETVLYLVRDKKAVKRGFLFGPLCPIYGFGACLSTAVLYGRVKNVFLIFLIGMLLTGTLEYMTHFVMEKFFHAMWWDYSNRRFNLKGRIYLQGVMLFGLGVVLIVSVFQPLVVKLTDMLPMKAIYIADFVIYSILLMDVAIMVSDLKGTANALKGIQNEMLKTTQKGVDLTGEQLENAKKTITESELYTKMVNSLARQNPFIERFKNRYPNFTFKRYKYILDIIMNPPMEEKARKDITLYGTAETLPESEEQKADEEN